MLCLSWLLLAPAVAPTNISGGGGSRSELIITWEVIFYPAQLFWGKKIQLAKKNIEKQRFIWSLLSIQKYMVWETPDDA